MNKFTMDMALKRLKADFKYVSDKKRHGFFEVWSLIKSKKVEGDCEDFALSLLYRLCDKRIGLMLWKLLTREAKIVQYKHKARGSGHVALEFQGLSADNICKGWNIGELEADHGYARRFAWPVIGVIYKLLLSKFIQLFTG